MDTAALIDAYVQRVVDNMSTKDLMNFVFDVLAEEYNDYSHDDLVDMVRDNYPELLTTDNKEA